MTSTSWEDAHSAVPPHQPPFPYATLARVALPSASHPSSSSHVSILVVNLFFRAHESSPFFLSPPLFVVLYSSHLCVFVLSFPSGGGFFPPPFCRCARSFSCFVPVSVTPVARPHTSPVLPALPCALGSQSASARVFSCVCLVVWPFLVPLHLVLPHTEYVELVEELPWLFCSPSQKSSMSLEETVTDDPLVHRPSGELVGCGQFGWGSLIPDSSVSSLWRPSSVV